MVHYVVSVGQLLTHYDWSVFTALILIDLVCVIGLVYRLIVMLPSGSMTLTYRLLDVCAIFTTFWAGTRVLAVIVGLLAPDGLLANPTVFHGIAGVIGLGVPTLLCLSSLYNEFMGNPYLTADHFKAAKDS